MRRRNPEKRHCGLLAKRADACLLCDIAENPYRNGKVELALAAARNPDLVDDAIELYEEWSSRVLSRQDLLVLTPEEMRAIRTVQWTLTHYQTELLAVALAPAKVMSQ